MIFGRQTRRNGRRGLVAAALACFSLAVVAPLDTDPPARAAAGHLSIFSCLPVSVASVTITFAAVTPGSFTINTQGCTTTVPPTLTNWTSGTRSTTMVVTAAAGYALPRRTSMNTTLCINTCSPNINYIASGSTSHTYTFTSTWLSSDNGDHYLAWEGTGELLASAPSITTAAAVSGTATAGQTLTGSVTFAGSPTPTQTYQWYRCTASGAAGTSVPGTCTAVDGATATSYTLTAADAGYYMRFGATATNANGTATSVSAATSAVTMPAPTAVDLTTASDTGSSTSDNLTGDSTPNITVTGLLAGAGVTVTATKAGQSNVTCTFTASGTSGSCDLGSLVDGTWDVSATQSSNSVVSSASASLNVSVDTSAPAAPGAIDLNTGSDTGSSTSDNLTNDNTPRMSATGGSSGETITVSATKDGSTVSCSYVVGSATYCDLGTLTDGVWSMSAAITDAAGNVSAAGTPLNVTVDTAAPASSGPPDLVAGSDSGSSTSDNVTSDSTPTIAGTSGSAGETVTITATKGATTVSCTYTVGSATSCDLGTLSDGVWSVTERVTDLAGNQSTAGTALSMTVDTTAPSTPGTADLLASSDLGSSPTDNATSDTTPAVSASGGSSGDTVTMTATKGASTETCTYTIPAAGSCDLPALTDGVWAVSAKITDAAGNQSASGTAVNVTVDTTAPSAPSAPDLDAASDSGSSSTDNVTNDNTPRMSATGASSGETVTISATKDGSTVSCSYVVGSATYCDLGTLTDGTWSVTATTTDSVGNVSPSGAALSITVDTTAPTVALTSTPAAGSLAGQPTLSMTATFSEPVTGFSATSDITRGGTSTGWTVGASSGSGAVYTYAVTPSSATTGTITQSVNAAAATDLAGNSSTVSSTWSAALIGAAPVNTAVPTVSGTAVSGNTLTASTGTWNDQGDNSPTTAYKWQYYDTASSQWVDIPGATSSTFVITDSLDGKAIRVGTLRSNVVGAAVAGYAFSTQTAAVTLPPASNSVAPTISGTVAAGNTLTASPGTWTGSQNSFTYQWKLNGTNISGATSSTYPVAAGDVTGTISVEVTATNGSSGTPVSAVSVGTPSRPTITSVTPGDGTMSVAFTPGATNGSTVTGYEVTATVNGTAITQPCAASPCLMTGLVGGTQYAFTVRPLTSTVTGPYSLPVNGTPTASAPSAPVLDSAVASKSPNAATVAFTPGATNGSVVSGYKIVATPPSGSPVSVTCTTSPCDVPGLTPGITYTFTIVAVATVAGVATESPGTSANPQVTLPKPQTVTFTAVGDKLTTDSPITVSVSAESGLAVTVVSTTPTVCTVSGTKVTLLRAGTCTLTGTQGGNSAWLEGTGTVSFAVTKPASNKPANTATGLPVPVKRLDIPSTSSRKNVPITAVIGDYPETKAPTHVVFVVRDIKGDILSTVKVVLPEGSKSVDAVLPVFPKGATVSTYTTNRIGDGGGVRVHTAVVYQPLKTIKKVNPSGRPILAGLKISDPVYFLATLDKLMTPQFGEMNTKTLQTVVSYVKRRGGQILITGFARQNGTDSAAVLKALSTRRARNVANYLADRGVRVWVRFDGFGAASKGVGNWQDRRVDIRWVSDSYVVR